MAYKNTTIGAVAGAIATNWFRPPFLRTIARASVEWSFKASTSLHRVGIQSLVQTPQTVSITISGHTWGETSVEDLIALCTLVSARQPTTVFEFGTFTGHTTVNLAMNSAKGARILTLDLPAGERGTLDGLNWEKDIDDAVIGLQYRSSPYSAQITQILGDSRAFDVTPYVDGMDFVFVDACHEAEFVINDSEKAFQMLSPCGVIAWHDYSRVCPGVTEYLDNLARVREVFIIDGTQIAFCRGKG